MEGQKNPWAELGARPWLELVIGPLPPGTGGAMYVHEHGLIVIDKALGQAGRQCALVHEIGHADRGGGCPAKGMPDSWQPVRARDEAACDDLVCDWLVPAHELERIMLLADDVGEQVAVHEVADHFNVTPAVAERAMLRLLRTWREGYGEAG